MDWHLFQTINRGADEHARLPGGDPPNTFWTRWFLGVAVPIAAVAYAAYGQITGSMWVPHHRAPGSRFGFLLKDLELHCAAGILLGLAVAFHAYAFWGQKYCLDHPVVKLPMALGLLLGVSCAGVWSARWLMTG